MREPRQRWVSKRVLTARPLQGLALGTWLW